MLRYRNPSKMPHMGFKSITVSEETYALAERMANQDNVSLPKLIRDALETYFSKKLQTKEKVKIIAEVLEQQEGKESK